MVGVINIYKPKGWTSREAVDRVARLVRPAKAGHAGTLDPLAEGVLVVCVGQATRLIEYVQRTRKVYRATFLLGRSSASDDLETEVVEVVEARAPTRGEVDAAMTKFVGVIRQRPPAYSAVKVGGRRAYKLARRGKSVELAEREVVIYRLDVLRYEYPELELELETSSGAYVRSVGRDLAEALGTRAVMSELVRTAVGAFRAEDAVRVDELDEAKLAAKVQPALAAVADMPRVTLTAEQAERVVRGGLIGVEEVAGIIAKPQAKTDASLRGEVGPIAALDEQGRLLAILKEARPGLFKPSPNFLQAE